MIYDVRQSTVYRYASPAAYAHHVLRLTPVDRDGQRVHATMLDVTPAPFERHDGNDFFGNRMTWIALDEPHDTLTVRLAARVTVDRASHPDAARSPPWESVRGAAFGATSLAPMSPAHCLFPSRQVSLDPEIRAYAAESFAPHRPMVAGVCELMRRIKADFTYEPGATNVLTTPPMSFALRRGVCQDFAHIMISGLRGLGLPAAYVSGYLRTAPPPGQERLEGADAMHAWVLAWCGPEVGWCGFDPTNAMLAGNDHVTLAVGRDYADVSPVDGVIFAAGRQKLEVSVTVVPIQ